MKYVIIYIYIYIRHRARSLRRKRSGVSLMHYIVYFCLQSVPWLNSISSLNQSVSWLSSISSWINQSPGSVQSVHQSISLLAQFNQLRTKRSDPKDQRVLGDHGFFSCMTCMVFQMFGIASYGGSTKRFVEGRTKVERPRRCRLGRGVNYCQRNT